MRTTHVGYHHSGTSEAETGTSFDSRRRSGFSPRFSRVTFLRENDGLCGMPHGPPEDFPAPPDTVIETSSENGPVKSICPASVSASNPSIKICTRTILLMFWVKESTTQ